MFQGSSYDHFSILIFPRHEYLISQILTFLYSMHFFQYTCKVKLLQRTSFHGYRLMIKSSNYKTLLIFPGSRIFSLFPEFQVIFDFLEFQKKAVSHPCTLQLELIIKSPKFSYKFIECTEISMDKVTATQMTETLNLLRQLTQRYVTQVNCNQILNFFCQLSTF